MEHPENNEAYKENQRRIQEAQDAAVAENKAEDKHSVEINMQIMDVNNNKKQLEILQQKVDIANEQARVATSRVRDVILAVNSQVKNR